MKRESKKRQLVKDASGNVVTKTVKDWTMAVYRTIVKATQKDAEGNVVRDSDGKAVVKTYTSDNPCPDVEVMGDATQALEAAVDVFGVDQVFEDFFYGHDLHIRRMIRPAVAGTSIQPDDELLVMGWIGGSKDAQAATVKGQWKAATGAAKKKVLVKALDEYKELINEFHGIEDDEE